MLHCGHSRRISDLIRGSQDEVLPESMAKNPQDQEHLNQNMNLDVQQEAIVDQLITNQPIWYQSVIPPRNIAENLDRMLELIQEVVGLVHQ